MYLPPASQSDVPTKSVRVLVADDHPMIRAGLIASISKDPALVLVGEAANGFEAISKTRELRPHVVLMDLRMPELGGLAAIQEIRRTDESVNIIVFTTFSGEEDIYQGLQAGARGYLLKDAPCEEVLRCIGMVASGRRCIPAEVAAKLAERMEFDELSGRETEILKFLASGKSNKVIARMAGIGEGTVKFHVNNILSKLSVTSRTEAVTLAARRGLIQIEGSA